MVLASQLRSLWVPCCQHLHGERIGTQQYALSGVGRSMVAGAGEAERLDCGSKQAPHGKSGHRTVTRTAGTENKQAVNVELCAIECAQAERPRVGLRDRNIQEACSMRMHELRGSAAGARQGPRLSLT